ncbi:hypothetical protein [Rhodoplanes serenus]|uniref:hypothetical protein n=1 Tax=Rhodoplanes serenus TaxID=200615 RepID=UPI003463025B
MKTKRRGETDRRQGDLFAYAAAAPPAGELFPVRERADRPKSLDLSLKIKTALGKALKECPHRNAYEVAAAMSELLGREITADALYAYTAPAKPEHEISLLRFVAFVRVTGAWWLWDELVEDDGLIVMQGREAHLAQLGLLQQHRQSIEEQIKALQRELKERPVTVAPRRGSR